MADEWQPVLFKDVLINGTRNGVYKKKEFHGSGVKIVNMGELFAHPRLRDVPMKRVELSKRELDKSSLLPGDLLFARRSLVAEGAGKCSIVMEVSEPTTFESSIIRARPDDTKVDSLFLYYMCNSPLGRYLLGTIRRQVAVSGITGTDLVQLDIPRPPLTEQLAIAEILGSLDDKIELNRRMNVTLESMARAIFKAWFIDFEPVKAKAAGATSFRGMPQNVFDQLPKQLTDSELGPIPKGWEVGTLGEVCKINERSVRKGDIEGEIQYVDISSVTTGHLDTLTLVDFTAAPSRARRRVTHGDTIWSCVRPNRRSYLFIHTPPDNLIVSTGFAVLSQTQLGSCYLYEAVTRSEFVDYLTANADGSAYPAVRPDHFAAAEILIPDAGAIDAFETAVWPMRDRIAMNSKEAGILAATRDALLPKLISGAIRVEGVYSPEEAT